MKKYKIELSYFEYENLISTHKSVDNIPDISEFSTTFAREKTYEGVFMDITNSLQFTETDKAFVDEIYFAWKEQISNQFYILVNVEILDIKLLEYIQIYQGRAEIESIKVGELATEISFIENTLLSQLKKVGKQKVEVYPVHLTNRNFLLNANELFNSLSERTYKQVTALTLRNDSWYPFSHSKLVDNNNILLIDDERTSDILIDYMNYTHQLITGFKINTFLKINWGGFNVAEKTVKIIFVYNRSDDYPSIREFYEKTFTNVTEINDRIDIEEVMPPDDYFKTYNYTLQLFIQIDGDYEHKCELNNVSYTIDNLENPKLETKGVDFGSMLASLNDVLKINIHHNSISDFNFYTYKNFENLESPFDLSFLDLFEFVKKIDMQGLYIDNEVLKIASLEDIYNNEIEIIHLGDAIFLNREFNTDLINKTVNFGIDAKVDETYLPNFEFMDKSQYILNNQDGNDINILSSKYRIESTNIDNILKNKLLTHFKKKESKDIISFISDYTTEDIDTAHHITNGYPGNGWNVELTPYYLHKKWEKYFNSFLGVNVLDYTTSKRNIDIFENEIKLVPINFNKTESGKLFGIEKYKIEIEISPQNYNTIKNNVVNRFSINYNDKKIVFFLQNIEIELINNSTATIIGIEAGKQE